MALNLFSTKCVPKHDLRKKPTSDDAIKSVNDFLQRNFYIICVLAIIFLLIMFVVCCYLIVGVSAVESGIPYNHMEQIIQPYLKKGKIPFFILPQWRILFF